MHIDCSARLPIFPYQIVSILKKVLNKCHCPHSTIRTRLHRGSASATSPLKRSLKVFNVASSTGCVVGTLFDCRFIRNHMAASWGEQPTKTRRNSVCVCVCVSSYGTNGYEYENQDVCIYKYIYIIYIKCINKYTVYTHINIYIYINSIY